jgi:hypothetical protein
MHGLLGMDTPATGYSDRTRSPSRKRLNRLAKRRRPPLAARLSPDRWHCTLLENEYVRCHHGFRAGHGSVRTWRGDRWCRDEGQVFLDSRREKSKANRAKRLVAGGLLQAQLILRSVAETKTWPPFDAVDA